MKLKSLLLILSIHEYIRIFENNKLLFSGFNSDRFNMPNYDLLKDKEIKTIYSKTEKTIIHISLNIVL